MNRVWIGRAREESRQLDARAHATMDAQLNALAKAQDALRNAVSVGLGEMRTAYEGVARESATEAKGRASEREAARRAIETSEQAREKLEQKLLQCEEALREAKGALVETREQAKDVRVGVSSARAIGRRISRTRREHAMRGRGRGGDDDETMYTRVSRRRATRRRSRAMTRARMGVVLEFPNHVDSRAGDGELERRTDDASTRVSYRDAGEPIVRE